MKRSLFIFSPFSLIFAFSVIASDIALLESPQSFTIFNEFEQPLSEPEKSGLPPFCPFTVVQADMRLGDQITRAMQCRYRQKNYYLLKDEKGALIGDKTKLHLLKGCAATEDTVEIVKGGVIAITGKSPLSAVSRFTLSKGARIITVFRYASSYYARQTATDEGYCWVPASARDSWKRIKQAVATIDTSINEALAAQLARRIAAANDSYRKFFDRLSAAAGQGKTVPKWTEEAGGAGRSWRLSEPYSHTGELDASTGYIIKGMQEILIGKPFLVRYEKGLISVVRTGAGRK
jgi:hypothetical protein